jgi:cbb3-type cytochrome oxidase subunit 3
MLSQAILSAENVEWFGMVALIVMLAVFIGVVIWVVRIDKKDLEEYGQLPLDTDDETWGERI